MASVRGPTTSLSRANFAYLRPFAIVLTLIIPIVALAFLLREEIGQSFAFLLSATGWDISLTLLPYSTNDPYWWAFLVGLVNTIAAGSFGVIGATLIGFGIGTIALSRNAMLTFIARFYTDVVRNIPLILQAIFWYSIILHLPPVRSSISVWNSIFLSSRGVFVPKFANAPVALASVALAVVGMLAASSLWQLVSKGDRRLFSFATGLWCCALIACAAALVMVLPQLPAALKIELPILAGLNFRGGFYLTPEFAATVIAIVVYRSAFMGEIFRGGLTSTSRGHLEAAKSLGLARMATLWKIRLPIALVHIVPPLSNEYLNILKVTAIGIIIGFPDLFWVSSNATMQTGRPLQVLTIMVILYLALNLSTVGIFNFINARIRGRGFQ